MASSQSRPPGRCDRGGFELRGAMSSGCPTQRTAGPKLVRATALGDEVHAIAGEVVAELEARPVRRLGAERVAELRRLLQGVNAEL